MRLIDCHHAQKTSKLPYFRLFRPDTQILSALTALYWPSTAFYWPSTTKYQPVPSYTDPVPSGIKHHCLILIHCHQVLTSRAPYWPITIMDQPVSPSPDPVPPSTDWYCPLMNQYHHIPTSTAPYWPSTTKYQSIPTYTDPVSSYINQCRLPLTQYRQVPTSTTPYWPGTTKDQPFPTYTVVAWGLQTPGPCLSLFVRPSIRPSCIGNIMIFPFFSFSVLCYYANTNFFLIFLYFSFFVFFSSSKNIFTISKYSPPLPSLFFFSSAFFSFGKYSNVRLSSLVLRWAQMYASPVAYMQCF